jgi:hypothetical protein
MVGYASKTTVEELASFLQSRKNQGQRVGLLLGHRVGVLYNDKLYEALKSHVTSAMDLLELLKHDTSLAQELSKWAQHIRRLADLPTPDKFRRCYYFLDKHFSENGIHSILFNALASTHPREEDEFLVRLIKGEFFDTILTTNVDTLLEEACDLLGMKKPGDYELFACGRSEDSIPMSQSSGRCGQIVKLFGDFDSLNYKIVGNKFDLEAHQPLKESLMSKLAKDIVILGYDPTWDQPIERAFQENGAMLWYVNEEQPSQNTHLAHVLGQRYGKYLGGPDLSYHSFLQTLSGLVVGKARWELQTKVSPPLAQPYDPIRKKVFISYSHKDKEYLERLRTHLKGFLHATNEKDVLHIIRDNVWDDTAIPLGADWQKEIREALAHTKVAVLLVSADFFASDFIRDNELPVLVEAAKASEVQILSVVLKPCAFAHTSLFDYQAINSYTAPLMGMEQWKQEAVWVKLAEQIFTILEAQISR